MESTAPDWGNLDPTLLEPEESWSDWVQLPAEEEEETGRARCTSAEKAERVAAALELLQLGYGSALTAKMLADRYGVTPRQARNYTRPAAQQLYAPISRSELLSMAQENLHALQTVSGEAMAAGDHQTAIKSNAALAASLARYLRTFSADDSQVVRRISLRSARTRPEIIG
jgi:hypothetical protein